MKTGDIVEVFDGSWSISFKENGSSFHECGYMLIGKLFEIIAVGLQLPTHRIGEFVKSKIPNDTILREVTSGKILFTQFRFCKVLSENEELKELKKENDRLQRMVNVASELSRNRFERDKELEKEIENLKKLLYT